MERIYDYLEYKGPFNCEYTTALKAGNTSFHMHNNYEVYLLLKGSISYFVEQSCYHMHSGDIILFTNQEIHKATNLTEEPFTRLVIHLNPSFIRQCSSGQTNLLSCFQHRTPGIGNMISLSPQEQEQFCRYFHEIQHAIDQPEYGSDRHTSATMVELLLLVNRCYRQTSPVSHNATSHKIQPVMEYIDQHLSEPLTLDSIARGLSINKYYISHLFKQETESTIFQYIQVKRIALAKQYLSDGCSVTDTCHQAGFNDYCNFIRLFKKITGYTPGNYRKQIEGDDL